MKKTHTGHTRKHTGTKKHGHTLKHHATHHRGGPTAHGHKVHTVAKHAKHAKGRGLALGDALPVCSAEALAMSLRLAGQRVSDDEVAELWWLTGAGEDGASIAATLDAAARFGLAGVRDVAAAGAVGLAGRIADEDPGSLNRERPDAEASIADRAAAAGVVKLPVFSWPVIAERVTRGHAVILGVDLPGPHAVLATADGWWSWGELYSPSAFPHAVIEEAWAVSWS